MVFVTVWAIQSQPLPELLLLSELLLQYQPQPKPQPLPLI